MKIAIVCYPTFGGSGVIATELGMSLAKKGHVIQANASNQFISQNKVISTDPPYYDNIGYADLSDYFYVWLRKGLKRIYPQLFATILVPKKDELVACPGRHGGRNNAENFFLSGMTEAMSHLSNLSHKAFHKKKLCIKN